MQVDWKALAQTPGYRSLKAAYIRDVQEAQQDRDKGRHPMRGKAEFQKLFRWVIARAMHYAHHNNCTLAYVLNEWELQRTYWWLNYYQSGNQPLLARRPQKHHTTLRGYKRYIARDKWNRGNKVQIQQQRFKAIMQHQQENRTERRKKKPRWSMAEKRMRL